MGAAEEETRWAVLEELSSALAMVEAAARNREEACALLRDDARDPRSWAAAAWRSQQSQLRALRHERDQLLRDVTRVEEELRAGARSGARGGADEGEGSRSRLADGCWRGKAVRRGMLSFHASRCHGARRQREARKAASHWRLREAAAAVRRWEAWREEGKRVHQLVWRVYARWRNRMLGDALYTWVLRLREGAAAGKLLRRGVKHMVGHHIAYAWNRWARRCIENDGLRSIGAQMFDRAFAKRFWLLHWRKVGSNAPLRNAVNHWAHASISIGLRQWMAFCAQPKPTRKAVLAWVSGAIPAAFHTWLAAVQVRDARVAAMQKWARLKAARALRAWEALLAATFEQLRILRLSIHHWERREIAGYFRCWHSLSDQRCEQESVVQRWRSPVLTARWGKWQQWAIDQARLKSHVQRWRQQALTHALRRWTRRVGEPHLLMCCGAARWVQAAVTAALRRWVALSRERVRVRRVCSRWLQPAQAAAFARWAANGAWFDRLSRPIMLWEGRALASAVRSWSLRAERWSRRRALRRRVVSRWACTNLAAAHEAWLVYSLRRRGVRNAGAKVWARWTQSGLLNAMNAWRQWRCAVARVGRLLKSAAVRIASPALGRCFAFWRHCHADRQRIRRRLDVWKQSQLCCVLLGCLHRWTATLTSTQVLSHCVSRWKLRLLSTAFKSWASRQDSPSVKPIITLGHSVALWRRLTLASVLSRWRARVAARLQLRRAADKWRRAACARVIVAWRRRIQVRGALKVRVRLGRRRNARSLLQTWHVSSIYRKRWKALVTRALMGLMKVGLLRSLKKWVLRAASAPRKLKLVALRRWRQRSASWALAMWASATEMTLGAKGVLRSAVAVWMRNSVTLAFHIWEETLGRQRGRARVLVSALMHSNLSSSGKALRKWNELRRNFDLLKHASVFWIRRRVVRAFHVLEMLHLKKVLERTRAARCLVHRVRAAIRAWASKTRTRPEMFTLLCRHTTNVRTLRRCLRVWRLLSLYKPILRRAMRKRSQTTIHGALKSWKQCLPRRMAKSWRLHHLYRCAYRRWHARSKTIAHRRRGLRRAAVVWASGAVARVWRRWGGCVARLAGLRRAASRLRHYANSRAWRKWCIVRTRQTQVRTAFRRMQRLSVSHALRLWLREVEELGLRRYLLQRMFTRWRCTRLTRAFSAIRSFAVEGHVFRGRLKRGCLLWRHSSLAASLSHWRLITTTVRRAASIGHRIVHMRAAHALAHWAEFAAILVEATKTLMRVQNVWRHSSKFVGWIAIATASDEGRSSLRRAASHLVYSQTARHFNAWSIISSRLSSSGLRARVSIQRLRATRLCRSFFSWASTTQRTAELYGVILRTSRAWMHSHLHRAVVQFASYVNQTVRGHDYLRTSVLRWRRKSMLRALAQLVSYANQTARVHGHVRTSILRWRMQSILHTLRAWAALTKKCKVLHTILRRWTNTALLSALGSWLDLARARISALELLGNVLERWARHHQAAAMAVWCDRHISFLRSALMLQTCATKWRSRKVAAAFGTWRAEAALKLHSRQSMAEWVTHALQAALVSAFCYWRGKAQGTLRALLCRAVGHFFRPKMAACFHSWEQYAVAQKKREATFRQAAARFNRDLRSAAAAFNCWRELSSAAWYNAQRILLLMRRADGEINAAKTLVAQWKAAEPSAAATPPGGSRNQSVRRADTALDWAGRLHEHQRIR